MGGENLLLWKYSAHHLIEPDNISSIHFIIPENDLIEQNLLDLWLSQDIAPGF